MTDLVDALYERGRQLARNSFCSVDQLSRLPRMNRAEIDALPFGVVKVDDTGVIRLYNRYEADLGGIEPTAAEGRNFFAEVAICTNNNLFLGAFRRGVASGDLDLMFPYTFTYKMKPTNVKVHMHRDADSGTNWILVQRA
jgi:photoactive yellow protein